MGLALALASCGEKKQDDQSTEHKIKAELDSRRSELRSRETELESLEQKTAEIRELAGEKGKLAEEKNRLLDQTRNLEKQVDESRSLLQAYKSGFRVATPDLGATWGDITLSDGRKLDGVVLTSINLPQIGLRHANGLGNYPITSLPPELQAQFVLDPQSIDAMSDGSIRNILGSKPDFLLSDEEKRALREEQEQAKQLEKERQWQAEKSAEMAERKAREQAENAREALQHKQSQESRTKRAELDLKINQLRIARDNIPHPPPSPSADPFGRSSRIQRSPVDIERARNAYKNRISALTRISPGLKRNEMLCLDGHYAPVRAW